MHVQYREAREQAMPNANKPLDKSQTEVIEGSDDWKDPLD